MELDHNALAKLENDSSDDSDESSDEPKPPKK